MILKYKVYYYRVLVCITGIMAVMGIIVSANDKLGYDERSYLAIISLIALFICFDSVNEVRRIKEQINKENQEK